MNKSIEGMMNDGLTDIDFKAVNWAEYSENHSLTTELGQRVNAMNGVADDGREEKTGDVSSANRARIEFENSCRMGC
ncbi:hypothetical protein [Sporosarcina sp. FSL K6-1508]|uniref:hypothetical protein n=1 Tax=Sporosarcina sp. FSL K6-1508 TaxID=2921553 RepID=UPI0030FC5B75